MIFYTKSRDIKHSVLVVLGSIGLGLQQQLQVERNNEKKKLQFIHMLTATDLRTSKTAKIKKLFYYITAHRRTSMCCSIKNYFFFIFAVSMCEGLSPLTCV